MAIDNQFEEGKENDEGIDSEADGEEGEGGKGGFDAKKIILFVVLPLFILLGVGAGLYFTGTLDKLMGGSSEESEHAEGGKSEKKDDGHGKKKAKDGHGAVEVNAHFLEIPNMIVNLSGPEGQPRYLRLSVQLEMETAEDMASVEAVMPRVVDQFQTYLRELRVKDLRGSAGIYRLQMELLSRVNAASYPVEVKDVLFQEILIQ